VITTSESPSTTVIIPVDSPISLHVKRQAAGWRAELFQWKVSRLHPINGRGDRQLSPGFDGC